MNKIIVIDGVDGVGKTTQVNLLKEKFPNFNYVKFPRYESHTGYLIKSYLNGNLLSDNFIHKLSDLDKAKTASLLYTLDRAYFFYNEYKNDGVYIFDRYTSSNAILQTAYLNESDAIQYIDWLIDMEHNKFNIPKPDMTIFLDLPSDLSYKNLSNREYHDVLETLDRAKKIEDKKDIVIDKYGMVKIDCYDEKNDKMRSIEDIHDDIIRKIETVL